jgi:hypothetical protein
MKFRILPLDKDHPVLHLIPETEAEHCQLREVDHMVFLAGGAARDYSDAALKEVGITLVLKKRNSNNEKP